MRSRAPAGARAHSSRKDSAARLVTTVMLVRCGTSPIGLTNSRLAARLGVICQPRPSPIDDILDMLSGREFDGHLIAHGGVQLDHLVGLVVHHADARIAWAGPRHHGPLADGGRGEQQHGGEGGGERLSHARRLPGGHRRAAMVADAGLAPPQRGRAAFAPGIGDAGRRGRGALAMDSAMFPDAPDVRTRRAGREIKSSAQGGLRVFAGRRPGRWQRGPRVAGKRKPRAIMIQASISAELRGAKTSTMIAAVTRGVEHPPARSRPHRTSAPIRGISTTSSIAPSGSST